VQPFARRDPEIVDAELRLYFKKRGVPIDPTSDFKAGLALHIPAISAAATARIQRAIDERDLVQLMACYDNKGLMALAATQLKGTNVSNFKSWLGRVMRSGLVPELSDAIRQVLPVVEAK
jgi:hypothetical protein